MAVRLIKEPFFESTMTIYHKGIMPDLADLVKNDPNLVNHPLLFELVEQFAPLLEGVLPAKRSGYEPEAYLYVQMYQAITQLSYEKFTDDLDTLFKVTGMSFQKTGKQVFSNSKERRAVPDQPIMSRFLQDLDETGKVEEFGNLVFHALLLYLFKQGLLRATVTLIADYVMEPCHKNKEDPYCFGTKQGKTKHKTLVFSLISGGLHVIVATFAIKKRQPTRPLFQQVVSLLEGMGFHIAYALLDRGFYRKEIFVYFRRWGITVIMPVRACGQSRGKVRLWLQNKGGRRTRFTLDLGSAKKWGQKLLTMDMVLMAKRGYPLAHTKQDLKQQIITLDKAAKQVFPLLASRAGGCKVTKIAGNEYYLRNLYRKRWAIEIAFREMHKLGIANWVQGRAKRLFLFNSKCIAYTLWQVERKKLAERDPTAEALTLDEFCGRLFRNRSRDVFAEVPAAGQAQC